MLQVHHISSFRCFKKLQTGVKMANDYRTEQQTVRLAKSIALTLVLSGSYLTVNYLPLPTPSAPTLSNRLVFALRYLSISLIPLIFGIQLLGSMRFNDMENMGANPVREKTTYKASVVSRYIQNTIEQTLLHVLLQLALSTYLPDEYLSLIPMHISIFVVARFAFLYGYMDEVKPINRAFGFALTYMSNLSSFLLVMVFLMWKGPTYRLSEDGS